MKCPNCGKEIDVCKNLACPSCSGQGIANRPSGAASCSRLRAIFPKILEALESGACAAECSEEFLEAIPEEVRLVVSKLKRERLALAMLAADTPQFFNPLAAMQAKNLRDQILTENATTQTLPPTTPKDHD